jgi:poly(A) polymerase
MFDQLFQAFEAEGKELFFVGGFVRDKLIHCADMSDVDFATNAHPEDTMAILKKHGLKAIPIGIEFGTVQTIVNDVKVEITTFRCKESYKKGSRKPGVVFGNDIEQDLARRDFTFNAIAMKRDLSLIDPIEGFVDLLHKTLRTPTFPTISFSDDPLRMLRACRFTAKFDMTVEKQTFEAMCKMAPSIKEISAERVFQEMSKLLMLPDPTKGLITMVSSGLMAELFPEIQTVVEFRQNQGKWHSKLVWPHTLEVVKNSPQRLAVRWAALFHDVAKPQTYSEGPTGVHFYQHDWKGALKWDEVANRLKVSKEFRDHVHMLIYEHLQPSLLSSDGVDHCSASALRRLAHRVGDKLDDLFDLSVADITSHKPEVVAEKKRNCDLLRERIKKIIAEDNIPKLKLPTGLGLVLIDKLGLKPGKELGDVMKKLTELLIDGVLTLESDFVEEARKILENKNGQDSVC